MRFSILCALGLAGASVALGAVACSGSDSSSPPGADSGLPDTTSPQADGATPGVDAGGGTGFAAAVYAPIVSAHCTFCHGPGADGGPGIGIAFGHLDMGTEATAYQNLVGSGGGVPAAGDACGDAGVLRVVPGDPASSLLYNKLASNDGDGGSLTLPDGAAQVFCGSPMPLHGHALSSENLGAVAQWIEAGAQP